MRRRHTHVFVLPWTFREQQAFPLLDNWCGVQSVAALYLPLFFLPGILRFRQHLSDHMLQCGLCGCSSYAACHFGHFWSHHTCNELQTCREMPGKLHHSTPVFIINGGLISIFFFYQPWLLCSLNFLYMFGRYLWHLKKRNIALFWLKVDFKSVSCHELDCKKSNDESIAAEARVGFWKEGRRGTLRAVRVANMLARCWRSLSLWHRRSTENGQTLRNQGKIALT